MIKVQIIADTHGRFIPISKNVDGYFLLGDNSGSWIWDIQEQTKNGKFAVSVLGNHTTLPSLNGIRSYNFRK